MINNLLTDEENRNRFLNQILKSQFKQLSERDEKCHYIYPDDCAIHFSKQLLYWGLHIFENSQPQLAFRSVGRYAYPRMDFLKLVDYLEFYSAIGQENALTKGQVLSNFLSIALSPKLKPFQILFQFYPICCLQKPTIGASFS